MSIEDSGPHLQLWREGDQFLVSAFSAAGFKKQQLARLNRCRVYLQVTTLADLTNGSGNAITDLAWMGELDQTRPVITRGHTNSGHPRIFGLNGKQH